MPTQVDHDERIREMLDKSLGLFSEFGYDNLTFQQIAASTGVNRTSIYKYFANKRQLFGAALRQMLEKVARDFRQRLAAHPEVGAGDKLEALLLETAEMVYNNCGMLRCIYDYLDDQQLQGEDVARKVRSYTAVFFLTLKRLIREGVKSGEFRPVNCLTAANLLYAQLEALASRVAISNSAGKWDDVKAEFILLVSMLKREQSDSLGQR